MATGNENVEKWVWKIQLLTLRRHGSLSFKIPGFPGGTSDKEPACQSRRCKRYELDPWLGMIPWSRARQSGILALDKNPLDRGAWWATVHRIAKSKLKRITEDQCTLRFQPAQVSI